MYLPMAKLQYICFKHREHKNVSNNILLILSIVQTLKMLL